VIIKTQTGLVNNKNAFENFLNSFIKIENK
jgi:hypothetical protein